MSAAGGRSKGGRGSVLLPAPAGVCEERAGEVWAEHRSPQTASSQRRGGDLCRVLDTNFRKHHF